MASWLTWQGYLLGPFGPGGKTGAWESANLGVLVAPAIGFVATLAFRRAEEAAPRPPPPRRDPDSARVALYWLEGSLIDPTTIRPGQRAAW